MQTMMKRLARGLAAAALIGSTAAAAGPVDITFSGQISPGNAGSVQANGFNLAANTTAAQRAYMDAIQVFNVTPGSSYSFTFRYDSSTPSDGLCCSIGYPVTLVSGFVGGNTDFTGWVPRVTISDVSANRFVNFELRRTEIFRNVNVFSFAAMSFFAPSSSGQINFSPLPDGPFPETAVATATAQFGIFGTESHRVAVSDLTAGGVTQALFVPGGETGAIPEPASWVMLITGFGLVGARARRRRLARAVVTA